MNWNDGFSALYELMKVDPVSWYDSGSFDLVSGSVRHMDSGLLESADLTMTENPEECWVRVYLKAKQESGGARTPIFTGLTSVPERTGDGTRITYRVECYSVLKPLEDILTPRGYYAPAGAEGAQLVRELLSVGAAPVVVDGESPALLEPIVSEDSTTRLGMAQMILDAIGWRLRISGDGTIHVCEAASEPVAVFDTMDNDIIENATTDSQDWFSVPNCIRVVSGERYVEYKDDDPDDPTSTVSRKAARGGNGEIWLSDSASGLGDKESLAEYAMRKLAESQSPARKVTYARRYRPDVLVSDLVTLHLPVIGIDGQFKITSQTIELSHGARTSEEVVMV